MGLGAAMDLRTVAVVGIQGLGYTLLGIAGTLAAGALLGRWLCVRRATGILVGVGTAICDGSAIAAAAPVIGADDDDTSAALGIVFLLNATALHIPAKSIPWVRITPPNATRRSPEIQRTATGWAETSRTRWRNACEP